jgi:radical SAM superfamily enzyme YgiQ (UPF0313 family)
VTIVAERPAAAEEPLHRRLGVTDEELAAIRDRLGGREPNDLELAMFSVMWSEHCSYKSSRPLLRTLPTGSAADGVVAGPGENAGVILADTKFEFGIDPATDELILIDEVLTPDSSRFWDASDYEPGRAQASFDKQFVRDWLETQDWDKTPPGPELPPDVVAGTRSRYVEAFERITGASFDRYLAEDRIGR